MNPWRSLGGLPKPLYVLAAALLINRAGSMVIVLLAMYLTRGMGMSAELAGAVVTIYGAGSLCVSPVAGRLCDRYGASRVATTMLTLSGVVLLLFPLATTPPAIITAAIALSLVTEGFRPAVLTLVSELAPPDQRKTAFALIRLAANLGMSVGPLLGGILASWWFPAIFLVDGITSLIGALVLLLALDRRRKGDAPAEQTGSPASVPPLPTRRAFTDPAMLFFLFAMLGNVLVFFQFTAALPLYLVSYLGLSERTYGLVFTVNTALILALEVPLNVAMARWPARWSLALGAALVALGFAATGLATGFWTVMATVVVWTFGEMIMFPSASAHVADIAPAKRAGEYMGLYNMLFGLGFTVAPGLGVLVLERMGASTLWTAVLGFGLLSAVLLAFVNRAEAPLEPATKDEVDDEPPPSSRPLAE
ncbi:MAG: MFS transporter [Deltaproteobacteria bacterium]|nr:MFS transporter [Deltaproteobacteria bacterium]